MLSGGHAPNALPQTARANVNCRIFPGRRPARCSRNSRRCGQRSQSESQHRSHSGRDGNGPSCAVPPSPLLPEVTQGDGKTAAAFVARRSLRRHHVHGRHGRASTRASPESPPTESLACFSSDNDKPCAWQGRTRGRAGFLRRRRLQLQADQDSLAHGEVRVMGQSQQPKENGPVKMSSPGRMFSSSRSNRLRLSRRRSPVFGSLGVAALAAIGLRSLRSETRQVRHERSDFERHLLAFRDAPTGLLLISSSLSFHGSSFTRPPIGSAAIICGFCFVIHRRGWT